MRTRRIGITAVVIAWSASSGLARAHDGDDRSRQTVIKSRTFTIAKGQCPQLPADVEIQGLGLERTITDIEGANGDLRGTLLSRISGTATDNAGGRYTFSYQLQFRKAAPIPGTGIIVDTFRMTGTGVANGFSTFFRARVTFDAGFNPVAFELLEQAGDPFQCDPL